MAGFASANLPDSVPDDEVLPAEFTVKAPPETDIWAKPPSTERFNAPILYKSIPLDTFKRARVAFSANWSQKYDQGGLIIVLNGNSGDRKWVKTGIEFTHDKPHLSTVAKDRWADWSLLPVPSGGTGATLEVVREPDDSLWMYKSLPFLIHS
jgi:regulation of enolase protein 1 (concanavalin A-like superfamily)